MTEQGIRRTRSALFLAFLLAGISPPRPEASPAAPGWPPITPAERELAAGSGGQGSAVILFEEGTVDDRGPGGRVQTIHRRLKILAPEGLSRSEVSVTFAAPEQRLLDLEGRTIGLDGRESRLPADAATGVTRRPDGLAELRFRLPDARVGAILEYRYRLEGGDRPPMGGWVFQHEVPCLRSTFLWRPGLDRTSHWALLNTGEFAPSVVPISSTTAPESLEAVRFEMRDLPALADEPWGPPALETRPRLVTTYTDFQASNDDFWNVLAASAAEAQERFIARREKLAAKLLGGGTPPADFDARVRLAYEFAQGAVPADPEEGGAPRTLDGDADSLLAAGSADAEGRNLLFMAALAVLDIPATRAFIVDRDQAFLHRDVQSPAQFTRTIVAVTPGSGKVFFFSPATPSAPPGVLPWYAQGVTALLAGRNGAIFGGTPIDPPEVNRTVRAAELALDAAGALDGRVSVELAGQPEMEARDRLTAVGSEGWRSDLEAEWRRALPGVRIDSLAVQNRDSRDRNLSLTARLQADRIGLRADNQVFLNLALFGREARNPFGPEPRRQPVFLPWARTSSDNVTLSLPREWRLETVPDPIEYENALGAYRATWSFDGERLVYQRSFMLSTPLVRPADYPLLWELYDRATSGDAVLVPLVRVLLPPSKR